MKKQLKIVEKQESTHLHLNNFITRKNPKSIAYYEEQHNNELTQNSINVNNLNNENINIENNIILSAPIVINSVLEIKKITLKEMDNTMKLNDTTLVGSSQDGTQTEFQYKNNSRKKVTNDIICNL